jgi:diketogulonate reductase-like aldo/keto reductase
MILRWQIQRRVIIPKTSHKSRMNENINIFDLEISEEDLQKSVELIKIKD